MAVLGFMCNRTLHNTAPGGLLLRRTGRAHKHGHQHWSGSRFGNGCIASLQSEPAIKRCRNNGSERAWDRWGTVGEDQRVFRKIQKLKIKIFGSGLWKWHFCTIALNLCTVKMAAKVSRPRGNEFNRLFTSCTDTSCEHVAIRPGIPSL